MREVLGRVRSLFGACVIALGVILPIGVSRASADDSFTDIGVFQPSSININGVIAGYTSVNNINKATLWSSANGFTDLSTQLGSNITGSQALGINDNGEVVGSIQSSDGTLHAFVWTSVGGVISLGTLGGNSSTAYAVNNQGVVVGDSKKADGKTDAFMWTPSTGMVDLGNLGNDSSAVAVNNSGEIVGDSFIGNGPVEHAFMWTPSTGMVDLGSLPGANNTSWASDINDSGEIVGGSQNGISNSQTGNIENTSVYWTTDGVIHDIGDMQVQGFTTSQANGINNSGEITGTVQSINNGFYYSQPFTWAMATGSVILPAYQGNFGSVNNGIITFQNKEIANAAAINDNGTITGTSLQTLNAAPRALIWGSAAASATPSGLAAASPTQSPSLTWNSVQDATSYNIYRDGINIASSATNSYVDTTSPEGSHSYYVTAVISSTESSPSNTISVLVDRTAPTVGSAAWSANPLAIGSNSNLTVPASDPSSGVARGEYYLGTTDPGQGSGTSMAYSSGNLTASFGSSLTSGIYQVNIRAVDNAGNWSAVTTDYLVVYNPASGGISGHSNTMLPAYGTDVLPGLIQSGQTDAASFALTTKYDNSGNITSNSKLKFTYSTGSNCNKASQATNCHSLTLDSTSIAWLVISGTNNSQGTIQGTATLTVDGVTTSNPFKLAGIDGALLNPQTNDTFTIQIFAPGASPNTATPMYHMSVNIVKGSIKIS